MRSIAEAFSILSPIAVIDPKRRIPLHGLKRVLILLEDLKLASRCSLTSVMDVPECAV